MSKLDPDVASLLEAMGASGAPPLWSLPVSEARHSLEQATEALSPEAPIVRYTDHNIRDSGGDISLRLYHPDDPSEGPLVLLIHGGGWALGSITTHDPIARTICWGANATVVSVEYRLAPENPFPAGLEDCVAALEYCASLRTTGQPLVVMGDSAGGNLSAALAIYARDNGGPKIDAQILLYPCVDIRLDAGYPSRKEFGGGEYFLSNRDIEWLHGMYLSGRNIEADTRISPIFRSNFSGLPATLLITAGFDVLRDEGYAYHKRLVEAGVTSDYRCFEGTIHGFVSFAGALESGREALKLIVDYLRSRKSC